MDTRQRLTWATHKLPVYSIITLLIMDLELVLGTFGLSMGTPYTDSVTAGWPLTFYWLGNVIVAPDSWTTLDKVYSTNLFGDIFFWLLFLVGLGYLIGHVRGRANRKPAAASVHLPDLRAP